MVAKKKSVSDDFTYETEDGYLIELPAFNSVKPGLVRKIRKLSDVDQFFTVLEHLAEPHILEIVDELDSDEFEAFQRAWFEHSGIDLGE